MNKLKLTLIIQLIFFTGWGIYLLTSVDPNASAIYLETEPVDPRDMLSGTYVALSYKISNPINTNCQTLLQNHKPGRVYVKLFQTKTKYLKNKEVPIYEIQSCNMAQPSGDELWVQAKFYNKDRIYYGIEKYFVNENNPLKNARSGEVLAKVKINKYQRFQLLSLESLLKQ